MTEAGVYSVHTIGELHSMVSSLSMQGFHIITVLQTDNGMYHVVAQQESSLITSIRAMKGDKP